MQSNLRKKLIQLFTEADGEFISGQKISEELGCSRTAVWKHIEDLRKSGYELEAVRKLGYKMIKKPDKITEDEIRLGLKTKKMGQTIHFQDVVSSTQKIAHELTNNGAPEGTIIVADKQTEGRGRMARTWHSPEGNGIWMSIILRPEMPVQKTPQLTLLAAVAIVQAVEEQTGIAAEIMAERYFDQPQKSRRDLNRTAGGSRSGPFCHRRNGDQRQSACWRLSGRIKRNSDKPSSRKR